MIATDNLANRYFLVVDDEPFIRTLVARFLKRSGAAEVVEAADGATALSEIARFDMTFGAIITDVNMRPVNGIGLLRSIRTGANGVKRNTPVIMLTVHSEAELVAEALALDADAFVLKPVERAALIERVLRVLAHPNPIGSVASYGGPYANAALPREEGGAAQPAAVGLAPPTKPLIMSIERAIETLVLPDGTPAAVKAPIVVKRVALGRVKVNSILAQDIFAAGSSRLLLAAPHILSKGVLDRLQDLHYIHGAYAHIFVYEPKPAAPP